jgi:transcriptional regulator with XRE-family HTH domain
MLSTPVSEGMLTLLNMSTLFKDRLLEAIREKGCSQAELARATGQSRANISHWVNGRSSKPTAAKVTRVAEFLGLSALWLSEEKGPKRPGSHKEGKKVQEEDTDEGYEAFRNMYKDMPDNLKALWRRQGRDLMEAAGPPGKGNPFGKGKKPPGEPAAKKPKKKK